MHVSVIRRHPEVSPPSTSMLNVMSYNTWSKNGDDAQIAKVILSRRPDILLLQEIPPEVFGRLMDRIRDLYQGSTVYRAYEPTLMQAVVSRHPVESSASMDDKGKAQKVVLRAPDGPIVVFNVHPLRTRGWRHRYEQIASLLEEDVLPERAPVILGGDLNAPDHSQLYRLIAGHLENAHRAAGSGFGFTYPSSDFRLLGVLPAPPLVRIDHIFLSDHFVALRAGTIEDSGGSDHRPVFAKVRVKSSISGDARSAVPGAAAQR
jgi:vancomycin resistance protein VanJ